MSAHLNKRVTWPLTVSVSFMQLYVVQAYFFIRGKQKTLLIANLKATQQR